MLGYTIAGRYLFVVYTLKVKGIAKVITAMDMDNKTRKLYRERGKKWKKIPAFKTEEGERRFRGKHSIADYWDDLRDSNDKFRRPRLKPVTLKFDPLVLKKLKMLARERGISYNAYIRYLLSRDVEKEILIK